MQKKTIKPQRKSKKKRKGTKKKYKINWKARLKMAMNAYLSIIISSVNELNAPNKRQRSSCGLVDKLFSDSFGTPWTAAHQAPLSMRSPRQESQRGLHFIFQGIFLTQGSKPCPCIGRQILHH